ncbi:urokinase plasminogen activator surface receptor [Oreochromis niloticus]|uniref:urokinase plasminogen activator surface receptor n=1 Tax=Oreochromis niloticus TaxID=8128 RepID=UPI000DF3047B|nr:urokinase plasminogen activator surface receptor [Oreochromis niloticus]
MEQKITVTTPKAACALQCYECIPGLSLNCTETTKECPSNTQCGSFRIISYAGGTDLTDVKMKMCALAEECSEASVNLGVAQAVITSKCCTSDLCNTQDAPGGTIPSPNGKKCYQCDGIDCTKTLTCNGNEDHCISVAEGETTKVKGCTSKMICSNTKIAQISAIIGAEISCCQGDLCNSPSTAVTTTSQPSSTTASTTTSLMLLLFVTLLISLVLSS